MSENKSYETTPDRLYHGLTIDRFLDHWKSGTIRGLSSQRIGVFSDSRQNGSLADDRIYDAPRGTWLADDITHILQLNYGREKTGEGEVVADWSDIFQRFGIKGNGLVRQEQYKTRIITELSGVPSPKRLMPGCFLHDFFYQGDIPTRNISRAYVDQIDDAQRDQDIERLVSASIPRELIRIFDGLRQPEYPSLVNESGDPTFNQKSSSNAI